MTKNTLLDAYNAQKVKPRPILTPEMNGWIDAHPALREMSDRDPRYEKIGEVIKRMAFLLAFNNGTEITKKDVANIIKVTTPHIAGCIRNGIPIGSGDHGSEVFVAGLMSLEDMCHGEDLPGSWLGLSE